MTAEKINRYSPRQLVAIDNEVMKMSMPAKSAQTQSARGASVSGKFARAKSAPSTRAQPAVRKDVQPPEWEDDEFDRALAKALDAGAFDEMIAKALQDERDGKTFPL